MSSIYVVASGWDGPTSQLVTEDFLCEHVARLLEEPASEETKSWVADQLGDDESWDSVDGCERFRLVLNLEDGWVTVQRLLGSRRQLA